MASGKLASPLKALSYCLNAGISRFRSDWDKLKNQSLPILSLFKKIYHIFYAVSYKTGVSVCKAVSGVFCRCGVKWGGCVRKFGTAAKRKFLKSLKGLLEFFLRPVARAEKEWNDRLAKIFERRDKAAHSSWERVLLFGDIAGLIVRFFCGLLNYIAPAAAVFALVMMISSSLGAIQYGVAVEYDGELLGYVFKDSVYDDALEILRQKMIDETEMEEISGYPEFSLHVVSGDELIDARQLSDQLLEASDCQVVESTGVYIDGVMLGAVTDPVQLEADFEALFAPYRTGAEGETAGFVQDVSLQPGLYPVTSIVDYSVISNVVHSDRSVQVDYTVVSGDAPITIANKNNISLDGLLALNPGIQTRLWPGDVLLISQSVPYLSVKITRNETYLEDIPYGTQATSDRTYYVGYTKVITPGVPGSQSVNANVTYVNGEKTDTEVLSVKVLSEPVDETVIKGSLPVSGYNASRGSAAIAASVSTGTFGWPVGGNGGKITCGWWGYYGHTGIDIASRYGTPVVASDAGVVYKTGWSYEGYGRYVIVDHGNGYKTLYGHNSAIYVKEGETVSKGQTIAAIGSTGNSSGNHCHFEVIVNGVKKNPALYLG